ncbi:MAG: hypothetical protein R2750_06340 [Bacteroidales bacterium]
MIRFILNHVYIIDRGFDDQGNLRGLKNSVLEVDEFTYKFRFANLDGSNDITTEIEKLENIHFTYIFHLKTGRGKTF